MSIIESLLSPVVSILLISMIVSFLTSLANRLLVNREQIEAWRQELMKWQTELRKATRSGDKKLVAKIRKKERRMMQLQSKVFMHSMRAWPVSMGVVLVVWYLLLIPLYSGIEAVAIVPGIDGEFRLPMFWWYLMCSLLFGTVFSRVLGITVERS